jgi:hypothetical protein
LIYLTTNYYQEAAFQKKEFEEWQEKENARPPKLLTSMKSGQYTGWQCED